MRLPLLLALLSAPLFAQSAPATVTLTAKWSMDAAALPLVSGYRVYEQIGATWTAIGDVSTTSMQIPAPAAGARTFRVTALYKRTDGTFTESVPTAPVTVQVPNLQPGQFNVTVTFTFS